MNSDQSRRPRRHDARRSAPARIVRKPATASAAAFAATVLVGLSLTSTSSAGPSATVGLQSFPDPSGEIATINVNGTTDETNAFFQSLGTNGRSCASCHVASQAFGISAADVRVRFVQTRGQDALFAPVDGANCPDVHQGTAAGHSLLLKSGLIRVGLPIPPGAQFTITVIHDPYGCAIVPDTNGGPPIVSVYRRPLPTTNLNFVSGVMFDGRETISPLNDGHTFGPNLVADLTHQAIDATTGHAQAARAPTDQQLAEIVNFELGLFTAQARDRDAGLLSARGAQGGPLYLANQQYFPGMNDSLGSDPTGTPFNPAAMTPFAPWSTLRDNDDDGTDAASRNAARRAIAAGERLFNTAPIHITAVRGLNDNPVLNGPDAFVGNCTTCHDTPNIGNHSFPLPLDIGTGHTPLGSLEVDSAIAAGLAELRMPDLPVYLINGCPDPFNPTRPVSFYTSDPGKALLTGKCSDLNRIKGPILRGLAARAPYFHNGAAANLQQLVNFYNQRFQMGLTEDQKGDLVAFLNSL
jgi:cytochrome c peroxidase